MIKKHFREHGDVGGNKDSDPPTNKYCSLSAGGKTNKINNPFLTTCSISAKKKKK